MARYAVGDIQGCLGPLKCLLKQAGFSWKNDTLWVVGDVVNRGPDSLKTLRYLHKHRDNVRLVLGNHDLHLLAVAIGVRKRSSSDTLDSILTAGDRDELLDWLRQQPLVYTEGKFTMVHAGIPPAWSLEQTHEYAAEVEAALRGPKWRKFLANMYGNQPRRWKESLTGYPRLRAITNYLTRMRYLYPNGALDLQSTGAAPNVGRKVAPWFSYSPRATGKQRILFGHWAALEGKVSARHMYALDTGCVWGRKLSLYGLDGDEWHRCSCASNG